MAKKYFTLAGLFLVITFAVVAHAQSAGSWNPNPDCGGSEGISGCPSFYDPGLPNLGPSQIYMFTPSGTSQGDNGGPGEDINPGENLSPGMFAIPRPFAGTDYSFGASGNYGAPLYKVTAYAYSPVAPLPGDKYGVLSPMLDFDLWLMNVFCPPPMGCGLAAGFGMPEGSFSIHDWSGYPESIPRPEGPDETFRLIEGEEYATNRAAANIANAEIRRLGVPLNSQVHEIVPIKFDGDPVNPANKVVLPAQSHYEVTSWWNQLMRALLWRP